MIERQRLTAWADELRRVHSRLRRALDVARTHAEDASVDPRAAQRASRELLLYCHGFCVALTTHHRGEDRALFPVIEAQHPQLAPVLRNLERDHSMIDHLLAGVEAAISQDASPRELERHLEGVAALMENHFAYEERQLLTVLESLGLEAEPRALLGGL